jgi:hypothetical protein
MFIDIMGAKYPPPMGPILESNTAGEKRVLDLGAGNGAWYVPLDRFSRGRPEITHLCLWQVTRRLSRLASLRCIGR